MPKLVWDQVGQRLYETGTSKGVLYTQEKTGAYADGVAWNGLISVKQSPDGAEPTDLYADNIKYLSMTSAENFKGSVDAYTYPEEFSACDGSAAIATGVYAAQQPRVGFGLVYSTIVGNDTQGNTYGEKIHIIYGAKVSPSERSYETVNNDPNAITFSWSFTTTPVNVESEGVQPTAYICVDSTKADLTKFKALQELLYGNDTTPATLPTPDEIIALLGGGEEPTEPTP